MKRIKFIFLIISLGVSFSSSSQKLSLSAEEKKEFEHRAQRMIELFTETLPIIPSFKPDTEEAILRDKAIKNTLRLFIKGATMQLAYANGTKSAPIPMATYLSSLTDYEAKRELVQIDIIDFTIDDLKPHPTQLGDYIVTFKFVQRFRKKKNYSPDPMANPEKLGLLEWDYEDVTTKTGTAIVKKVTTQSGTKWIMYLGDIEAKDIEVIKN
jgi:hypothetical protein